MSANPYLARREKLLQLLPNNSVVFIATNKEARRNNDADYKYRCDSSFYYLTGFAEPEAAMVLKKDHAGNSEFILFCREKNKLKEIWDGKRAGLEGAVSDFGADTAFAVTDIDDHMPKQLIGQQNVYCRLTDANHGNSLFAGKMNDWLAATARLKRGEGVPVVMHDVNQHLNDMRLIKDDHEIQLMQKAATISAAAHKHAMQTVKPGMNEYELEAEVLYVFNKNACREAYTSIVAGGANACCLHYVENNQPLNDGDLVLIDAGGEYQNYAADITRTFPVNGTFTQPQKEVYNIVLDAQIQAINALQVGAGAKDYHNVAVRVLVEGLVKLGLLTGDVDQLIADNAYQDFYMHGTGHWLGMDVHDVGNYNIRSSILNGNDDAQPCTLEAGMVLTVEPGIYIATDNMNVPEQYRGIGIRIEDDILVTDNGPFNLTVDVPKTVEEIEALMSHNQ